MGIFFCSNKTKLLIINYSDRTSPKLNLREVIYQMPELLDSKTIPKYINPLFILPTFRPTIVKDPITEKEIILSNILPPYL